MRLDVLVVLLLLLLVVLDYGLTGGFYIGKLTELGRNIFFGISQRL